MRGLQQIRWGLAFALLVCGLAAGQDGNAALPDAPSASARLQGAVPPGTQPLAGRYVKYIPSDRRAVPFAAEDKFEFGLHDAFSLPSVGVWVLAAGWESIVNGPPNYGDSVQGFGKRLGAAALRDTSDTLLVDSVFAPVFHEDPRYYKVGRQRGYAYRFLYAVTRPIVTRTDSGGEAPNLALLTGDLAGTILTNAYYPAGNRGVRRTTTGFGRSLGAIALGNAFHEFQDDAMDAWRERRERSTRQP